MSRRLRSAPLGQENGRFGSAETLPGTASHREGIPDSSLHVHRALGDADPFSARSVRPPRVPRVSRAGLAVCSFVIAAALYLATHVAAALLGWRAVALAALAIIWLAALCWSWATSRMWTRRPR